jgi:hypothetical protein
MTVHKTTDFISGRPKIVVQQLGRRAEENDPWLYRECLRLRGFLEGCDFYDRDRHEPVGSIARRLSDGAIFAAPDYRFCKNPAFEILWLHERRGADRRAQCDP